jgi:hypothetical protein
MKDGVVKPAKIHWVRAINRAHKTNVLFVRIASDNIEELKTLWRIKDAELGKVVIRFGANNANNKVVTRETFRKYYRLPLGEEEADSTPIT